MIDDRDLAGLDPYDLMQAETARLDAFFTQAAPADWERPTRCAGWNARALLAHLAASEDYNQACIDGTAQDFLAAIGAKGAVDLASANEIGVRELDDRSTAEILETWRARAAQTLEGLRARDGGDIDSSVGAYPARWQAFHLAFELATHADDFGVPVTEAEAAGRLDWQAKFGRFAITELKPELTIDGSGGVTHVRGDGIDTEMPDEQFVQAVAARLPDDSGIDGEIAARLSATP
jgi:uncharacterized protein (TIGR03083 family)